MAQLSWLITTDRIKDLVASSKEKAIAEMVELLATSTKIKDKQALLKTFLEREAILSTGIGLGIAVPHARMPSVDAFVMALGRKKEGIEFGSIDKQPVKLVFAVAGPAGAHRDYLKFLSQVVRLAKSPKDVAKILAAATPKEVHDILKKIDTKLA